MNIYSLNIVVPTKTTDIYDKVAINKYPLIITCKDSELNNMLQSNEIKNFLKDNIKSSRLLNLAEWYIRRFDVFSKDTEDMIIPVCEKNS